MDPAFQARRLSHRGVSFFCTSKLLTKQVLACRGSLECRVTATLRTRHRGRSGKSLNFLNLTQGTGPLASFLNAGCETSSLDVFVLGRKASATLSRSTTLSCAVCVRVWHTGCHFVFTSRASALAEKKKSIVRVMFLFSM